MTNEITSNITNIESGLEAATPSISEIDGLAELRALESQVRTEKPGRTESAPDTSGKSDTPGAVDTPAGSRKRKFKVRPENTFRMALRQYWRLRDWMARRALGLPSEYAGVFIQGKDAQLVEPLVDPVIGVLETYAPDAIIFIEEKSPLLQLFIALAEVEQSFGATVNAVALELKSKIPAPKETVTEEPRPKFPGLNETTGRK